jgi:hypothetical protein
MKIAELMKQAEEALLKCFEEIPFAAVERISEDVTVNGKRPDLLMAVCLPEKKRQLLVEVKEKGQPKPVREGVNQILQYRELHPEMYGVLIAPYISPRAAQICTQAGVGYLDLAGNCSIAFDQVFIKVDGRENPFTRERSLHSLYSPKASRILRVLLTNPINKVWKVKELSEESNVSIGHVSNVKQLLDEREWITQLEVGFSLRDPRALLDEWSENYSYRKNMVHDYYALGGISEIEEALAEACRELSIKYALTGFSGVARLAPTVRYQRVMTYVMGGIDELAQRIDLKGVTSGANVSLLVPYDNGVFYGSEVSNSYTMASSIQIYLDLLGFRGRGEEAAEALMEQVIRLKW